MLEGFQRSVQLPKLVLSKLQKRCLRQKPGPSQRVLSLHPKRCHKHHLRLLAPAAAAAAAAAALPPVQAHDGSIGDEAEQEEEEEEEDDDDDDDDDDDFDGRTAVRPADSQRRTLCKEQKESIQVHRIF